MARMGPIDGGVKTIVTLKEIGKAFGEHSDEAMAAQGLVRFSSPSGLVAQAANRNGALTGVELQSPSAKTVFQKFLDGNWSDAKNSLIPSEAFQSGAIDRVAKMLKPKLKPVVWELDFDSNASRNRDYLFQTMAASSNKYVSGRYADLVAEVLKVQDGARLGTEKILKSVVEQLLNESLFFRESYGSLAKKFIKEAFPAVLKREAPFGDGDSIDLAPAFLDHGEFKVSARLKNSFDHNGDVIDQEFALDITVPPHTVVTVATKSGRSETTSDAYGESLADPQMLHIPWYPGKAQSPESRVHPMRIYHDNGNKRVRIPDAQEVQEVRVFDSDSMEELYAAKVIINKPDTKDHKVNRKPIPEPGYE